MSLGFDVLSIQLHVGLPQIAFSDGLTFLVGANLNVPFSDCLSALVLRSFVGFVLAQTLGDVVFLRLLEQLFFSFAAHSSFPHSIHDFLHSFVTLFDLVFSAFLLGLFGLHLFDDQLGFALFHFALGMLATLFLELVF